MPNYRIKELDLSTRIEISLEMLRTAEERGWGYVTKLAKTYNTSRTLLYKLRDRAKEALIEAMEPKKTGPKGKETELIIDRKFIKRAITIFPLLKGSIRDIELGLELMFNVKRSPGYISETLQKSGLAAAEYNSRLEIPQAVLGEVDEIFQGRNPCLTVVDGRSFLVLSLSPEEKRDETTWGVTLLELQERGIQFHDIVSDGAKGIQAGVKAAELSVPLRPDLFHQIREAHKVGQRLEREAYKAIELAERARRAEQERLSVKGRVGRPLKVKVPREQAEKKEELSIDLYDSWLWLWAEIRQSLEPINRQGELTNVEQSQETIETAVELLLELQHKEITAFAKKVPEQLKDWLAPLVWLKQILSSWRQELDAETEAFILWVWKHQQALNLEIEEAFSPEYQPVAQAYWQALSLFHRSSSLAEALHSWLRPYLQIHRGMPQWLFPLLTLFWNHHVFQRGKRAGHSPLELAGVEDVPSFAQLLDILLDDDPSQPISDEDTQYCVELPLKIELPIRPEFAIA